MGYPTMDGRYGGFYAGMAAKIDEANRVFGRPLTLTEKILAAHALNLEEPWVRGQSMIKLDVDRVAMQDATAQMALLQFLLSELPQVAKPVTLHCDHLITARHGAVEDLAFAQDENKFVYSFLRTAAAKFGIGYWEAGSGIIHQIVLENYAFPGALMIGTDSHTPNASGLSMLAIGVGGADAVEVMIGRPWEVLCPKIVGVRLIGSLRGWTTPKDIILYLCKELTTSGGTNRMIEYFGSGVESISATGRATICNMGAELGATTSVFPFDHNSKEYLDLTGRTDVATLAEKYAAYLQADQEVVEDPEKYYDRVIEIDLDALRPYINGPHRPDRGRPVPAIKLEVRDQEKDPRRWPEEVSACLVGSCTNSSLPDMYQVAGILDQALQHGLKPKVQFLVSPGSERVRSTLERTGVLKIFENAGCVILSNSCGPCIGQWKRENVEGENVIVSSFNRNFQGRNDGNNNTLSFLESPVMVAVTSLSGRLGTDPEAETFVGLDGVEFKLTPPDITEWLKQGLVNEARGYIVPPDDRESVTIEISPTSKRLKRLKRFRPWDGQDFIDLPILAKAVGQTTTDAISPAGIWLEFRGDLEKISENLLLGAVNAFTGEKGKTSNPLDPTDPNRKRFFRIAQTLSAANKRWVIVADHNYGEGSSREHAAMSPRLLGCASVLARSFPRLHERNLKAQGVLPLTFCNPDDYDVFGQFDKVSILNLAELKPDAPVIVQITKLDGSVVEIETRHTLTDEQIEWFKAGSAMNVWCPPGPNAEYY